MTDLVPPSRAVLFADSETGAVHKTQSDPQAPRNDSFSSPPRAVTFTAGDNSSNTNGSELHKTSSDPVRKARRKSHDETRNAPVFYDSRASTKAEFKRRASTLSEYYKKNPTLLPQLPYSLRRGWRRWKVIGMGIVMVADACIVPIILYYALTFGANIQEWIIFAIVATVWGGPTYVEFATRSWKLIKKENFYRPLGTRSRWALDSTEYVFIAAITAVTGLLAAGSAPHHPWVRVLSLPGPALLLVFGGFMFVQTIWAMSGRPAPFRVSSIDKGEKVKPGVYTLLEDIVAVDGGAGRPYREALDARYSASPRFRKLMRDLSLFWSIPALLIGIACFVVVCVHSVSKNVGYGVGWAVPFIWGGVWTAITVPWVHSSLHKEHEEWEIEHGTMKADGELPEPSPSEREEEKEQGQAEV